MNIDYKKIVNSNYTPITPYHILLELDSTKLYTEFESIIMSNIDTDSTIQQRLINYLKESGFEVLPIYYNNNPSKKDKVSYCSYVYDISEVVSHNSYNGEKLIDISSSGTMSYIAIHKTRLMCIRFNYYSIAGVFYATSENLQYIDSLADKFRIKEEATSLTYRIGITYNEGRMLNIKYKTIPIDESIANLDINKNYNDDIDYDKICNLILRPNKCLMIFHGSPGTGKTTLIKHLIHRFNSKIRFIYLPAYLAQSIDNPSLTQFFLDNSGDSVFIIEDAEALVASRSSGNTSLSGFLNASDGILSDVLSSKFIVTFNTDINNNSVDQALLRKGRLDYMYRFGNLTKEKASKFLNKEVDKDYSLTDLYNWDVENNHKSIATKSIGF
jgi:hypothetical protein